MKAYVTTTGAIFGLITVAHIWRVLAGETHLATDPWFLTATAIAIAFCLWAVRLLWRTP